MSSELARRIAVTLGALLVFRIGSYIPLPGINIDVWEHFFRSGAGGVLGAANTLSGGAIGRLSIFSLAIVPYVSAAILVQFLSFMIPPLRAVRNAGEGGRRRIDRLTLVLTLLLAAFQSYGIAGALADVNGLVVAPGSVFTLTTVATLTAGVLFVVWLCTQITERGIGNGIALVIAAGIVTKLPADIFGVLDLGQRGVLPAGQLAAFALLALALVAVVVLFEKARRREAVTFTAQGKASPANLSFKLNGAGIIPPIIAGWVLVVPAVVAGFMGADGLFRVLTPGHPAYLAVYALVMFLAVFLYTAFVVDPTDAAEKLRRLGGAIPQVAPGEPTAEHLDGVVSRVTLIGATYFVVICLIPELLILWWQVPFYLGGISLLVLVCTVLDVEGQVREFARVRVGGSRQ
jgi:preprotein translocase subunit SecY